MIGAWAVAFVLTCVIELTVIRLLAPPRAHLLRIACYAQAVTHPLVWLAMATFPGPELVRLAGLELWATAIEAVLYARFLHLPRAEALGLSATANAASLVGVAALAALFA